MFIDFQEKRNSTPWWHCWRPLAACQLHGATHSHPVSRKVCSLHACHCVSNLLPGNRCKFLIGLRHLQARIADLGLAWMVLRMLAWETLSYKMYSFPFTMVMMIDNIMVFYLLIWKKSLVPGKWGSRLLPSWFRDDAVSPGTMQGEKLNDSLDRSLPSQRTLAF